MGGGSGGGEGGGGDGGGEGGMGGNGCPGTRPLSPMSEHWQDVHVWSVCAQVPVEQILFAQVKLEQEASENCS
eukprot:4356158-Prymnesium_polylepis.1